MLFPELKLRITKLEEALNLTDSHMKTLRTELKTQKAIIEKINVTGRDISILNKIFIIVVMELQRMQNVS